MIRPDWEVLLRATLDHAVRYLASIPYRPVAAESDARSILAAIDRPVPGGPADPAEVLRQLTEAAGPGLNTMPSGRFFGYGIGGALPASVAADWLTTVWDQNAGLAEATPAAAAFEQVAIRWVLELLDLPRTASAALVTGAQRHDTLDRALRFLGFGTGRLVVIEADRAGRMRPELLAARLATLEGPTIVCAQVGNVNGGAIDPIAAIADAVDHQRSRLAAGAAWLHVDGAFGLWARASRSHRDQVREVERADSWATDAHKWINTPYDCGIAIVADADAHRHALSTQAVYLPAQADPSLRVPFNWTPELSRRARGFALWAALCQLGRAGVEELVDRTCRLARELAERLGRIEGVAVMNEVLNQLVVRFRDTRGVDDGAHTREVVRLVQREGTCYPSATVWRGVAAMRTSLSNWSTNDADVEVTVNAILAAHEANAAS